MVQKTLRWLVRTLGFLFVLTSLNFLLMQIIPGDPALVFAGSSGAADQQMIAQIRAEFRLDLPLRQQYTEYLLRSARFDLGTSFQHGRPVWEMIREKLGATLVLTGSAWALSIALGVVLGLVSARFAGRWPDALISALALFLYAAPSFWLGLILVLVFSIWLGWLPAFGVATIGVDLGPAEALWDRLRHLILPALTLATFYIAIYTRLMRGGLLAVAQLDHIKTARAKGVPGARIVTHHMIRGAILPVVTYMGFHATTLISGAVLVETVFAWPGLGRLTFDAILQRNYPLLMGILLVTSVLVILLNALTDLLLRLVDPRAGVTS
jgi:peptide/nickel transport system permease protein